MNGYITISSKVEITKRKVDAAYRAEHLSRNEPYACGAQNVQITDILLAESAS